MGGLVQFGLEKEEGNTSDITLHIAQCFLNNQKEMCYSRSIVSPAHCSLPVPPVQISERAGAIKWLVLQCWHKHAFQSQA